MAQLAKAKLEGFAALDNLPEELCREVCFAARLWDPVLVLRAYGDTVRFRTHESVIEWLTISLHDMDEQDISRFAGDFRLRYRLEWPHHAAQATVLRYQPPVGVRPMRLRGGVNPRVRAAWEASERLLPR
jgi:hypothetical protein